MSEISNTEYKGRVVGGVISGTSSVVTSLPIAGAVLAVPVAGPVLAVGVLAFSWAFGSLTGSLIGGRVANFFFGEFKN